MPAETIDTAFGRYAFSNRDDYIAQHLRRYGEWEIHICRALLDVLKGPTLRGADVGANVGLFSIQTSLLARQMGKRVEIDAFEVQPRIFDSLVHNVALNSLQETIHPLHLAVGRNDGELTLDDVDPLDQANSGAFSLRQDVRDHFGLHLPPGRKITVPMVTLPTRYDFIKMDVEGMELDIVLGAEAPLRLHKPALLVEAWGPEKAPWFQDEARQLIGLLRDIYPKEFRMGENTLFWK